MVKTGTWKLTDVRSRCDEFLRHLIIEMQRRTGCGENWISNWNGSITDFFWRDCKQTEEWRQYQDELLKIAEPQLHGNIDKEAAESSTKKWEDIQIVFLSDERIQLSNLGGVESPTMNYAELGFEDKRNGKPNTAWDALRLLAENQGVLKQWDGKMEKRIQKIRSILRKRFQIDDDPIPLLPGQGYTAKFKTYCRPAYTT